MPRAGRGLQVQAAIVAQANEVADDDLVTEFEAHRTAGRLGIGEPSGADGREAVPGLGLQPMIQPGEQHRREGFRARGWVVLR